MNSHLLPFILFLFFVNVAHAATRSLPRSPPTAASEEVKASKGSTGVPGGWWPIQDVNDAHVVDVGKFAVEEHNKDKKAALVFVKVVRGEKQVVAGMNYRLVLEAADGAGGGAGNYEAVVWEKDWMNFRQLTSFKPVGKN